MLGTTPFRGRGARPLCRRRLSIASAYAVGGLGAPGAAGAFGAPGAAGAAGAPGAAFGSGFSPLIYGEKSALQNGHAFNVTPVSYTHLFLVYEVGEDGGYLIDVALRPA